MRKQNFYTYRDKTHPKLCKKCLTLHVDNFDPETFLWLFKEDEFDIPWIPAWWNKIRDQAFAKNPRKMTGVSVFGKYLVKTHMNQYHRYHWKDSEKLQIEIMGGKTQNKDDMSEEERAEAEKFQQQLKEQYQAGRISQAQYKTLMPTEIQNQELPAFDPSMLDEDVMNPFQEDKFIKEEELPDPAADLTHEDKIYLAMKWGRLYQPNEWIQLEKDYQNMLSSFEIKDADTKNALVLICKANLKTNQALDSGDLDGALKISRMYDSLRKSAKLTAAQNKEEKADFVDSVGELVSYCEKNGGKIPRMEITAPRDVIDVVIQDLKDYNKSLFDSDPSLTRQVEDYLKIKTQLGKRKLDQMDGNIQITDKDIADYREEIQRQREVSLEQEEHESQEGEEE